MSGVVTPNLPKHAEIAIVGAGVSGLTAALRLAQAGREVLVLDQSAPWRSGSGVNAGTLALQNKEPALLTFFRSGLEEWQRLSRELDDDIGYVRAGGLRVASTQADIEALRQSALEQARLGVETQWLEGSALRARAPWLAETVACATFCRTDGFANPLLAGRALINAVTKAGGRVVSHVKVQAQEEAQRGYRLTTSSGPVECDQVVIAAGPWSDLVARLFGVKLPIEGRINMVSVTERLAQFMDNLVVTHVRGRFTLKQFPNGSCLLGGGFPGRGDKESGRKELDHEQLRENLRFQCEVVPPLRGALLLRSWAGFEASTPDRLPVIGAFPDRPGLFAAVSSSAGFTMGPVVGRLAAEAVLAGETPAAAAWFTPGRLTA
jgi:sarcosine oxidase subunit beta